MVTVTDTAAQKIRELMDSEPEGEISVLPSPSRAVAAPAFSTRSVSIEARKTATTKSR